MNAEKRILELLAIISEQCGQQVSQNRLAFVYDALKGYPAQKVVDALQRIALRAKTFPTAGDILNEMGIRQLSPKENAVHAASLISGCIRRYGYTGTNEEVRAYIGPLAWQIVQTLGGWQAVCDGVDNDNESFLKTQWRDLAESMMTSDPLLLEESSNFLASKNRGTPVLKVIEGAKGKEPERQRGIRPLGDWEIEP
jgi:hypothetical protein